MNFLNYCAKWYLRSVIIVAFTLGCFFVFYIVGCQDLNFDVLTNNDCGNVDDFGVEGFSCSEPEMGEGIGDDYEGQDEDNNGYNNGYGRDGDDWDKWEGRNHGNNDDEFRRRRFWKIKTKLGRINVIFIVDNSESMKEELESIANQFDPFLNSIRKMDYRIAIITTDCINDRGQFLLFPNGQKFLLNQDNDDSVHRENVQHFQQTIKRKTEQSASNERGIYALNLALDNVSHADFFMPHSLLMIIVVSDEDEASYGGIKPDGVVYGTVPALEDYDLPDTFFSKVYHQHRFSIVTVHSIIVPPGDTNCKNTSGGIEGRIYAEASNPSPEVFAKYGNIKKGHVGSICSTNYSSQLGPIADTLVDVPPVPLPCFPRSNSVFVRVNGKRVDFKVEDRKVFIQDKVSFGSDAELKFLCSQK